MTLTPDATTPNARTVAGGEPPAETVAFAWRVHRLREEPGRAPVVAGAYAVAGGFGWLIFAHPLPVLLILVALTGALAEYLFPISYRLTDRGAHSGCGLSQLFIAWADVRQATHGADGVYLSPFAGPHPLDSFRGVRLRYGATDPATVLETVRRLRGPGRGGDAT
jgi:hypothetical protein